MALFNRMLYPLDEQLSKKAAERGLRYTRWVDDLTIGSQEKRGLEDFLGAVELVAEYFPVSEEKMFFQQREPIYLLGHRISNNMVEKNSKEDKEQNKVAPLNFHEYFGKDRQRNYASWI
jgi:hypothetical protein